MGSDKSVGVFMAFLGILFEIVTNQPGHEGIQNKAIIGTSVFVTSIYFGSYITYEIRSSVVTNSNEDEPLLILGHVRFLSGTLAATLLMLILIPWFGWLLFVMWIMFCFKIACCLDKPFYSFKINVEAPHQNTIGGVGNHNTNGNAGQEEDSPV